MLFRSQRDERTAASGASAGTERGAGSPAAGTGKADEVMREKGRGHMPSSFFCNGCKIVILYSD